MDHFFRASGPGSNAKLGLLAKLPGRWRGYGFNLIARPARQGVPANPPFFLMLNGTKETLEFSAIGGDIPNRGDIEPTIALHAVTYLQSVSDFTDNTGLHKEPGLWVHVPENAEGKEAYVRQATIPHGDSLLSQSTFFTTVAGGPNIQPVNSLPFALAEPIQNLNEDPAHPLGSPYIDPYKTTPLPDFGLPVALDPVKTIQDPTEILRAQIAGQTITSTDVIVITTAGPADGGADGNGILNIPFVIKNANASRMDAIFWIETVTDEESESEFYQLQYVQRVILDFDGVHWPHISVATLIKE